jgi:hypothetical protein
MEINRALSIHPSTAYRLAGAPPRAAPASRSDDGEASASKAVDRARRERVGELVGSIFYGTLLRQMNQSSLKGSVFHGGRGEEAFAGQMAQHMAERIGRSKGEPVSAAVSAAMQRRLGARRVSA